MDICASHLPALSSTRSLPFTGPPGQGVYLDSRQDAILDWEFCSLTQRGCQILAGFTFSDDACVQSIPCSEAWLGTTLCLCPPHQPLTPFPRSLWKEFPNRSRWPGLFGA
jgi:hypothetical protein